MPDNLSTDPGPLARREERVQDDLDAVPVGLGAVIVLKGVRPPDMQQVVPVEVGIARLEVLRSRPFQDREDFRPHLIHRRIPVIGRSLHARHACIASVLRVPSPARARRVMVNLTHPHRAQV